MVEAQAESCRTQFLLEIGSRLSASLNTRRCAHATAELATSFLADAATVVLSPDDRRRVRWLRAVAERAAPEEGEVPATAAAVVPGLREALAGLPGSIRWLDPGDAPEWLLPGEFGPPRRLLVAALPGNAICTGALVLARRADGPAFDADAEMMACALAVRAGAAISAAVLYEKQSSINAILTADLLPRPLPELEGMELAGSLRASQQAGQIGGDFYDAYLPEPGGGPERAAMLILGDVCGKGAQAAVFAGRVRHCLRALLLLESRPERLVDLLNRSLLDSPVPYSQVTLVLGALHRAARGHLCIDLAVAGHPPPLILRQDGTVDEVASTGCLLGVLEETGVRPVTVDLAPGEVCLLYSDGITEAFGGPIGREMYGEDRLKSALASCAGMPASALVERLEQLSTDWLAGGDHDDQALLAIRSGPPSGREDPI
ncbi:SpoIIE family protein phosphatase [Sphaerisporangium sp. NPDC051017]|uniref:PP2C family protein-serine/threonine phosphatase n=1 Tax=Sphaerisporangium sp. NPDC051017 TaxID=3154636 RepID=UPI00344A3412